MDITLAQQYIWKVTYRLVTEEEYTVLGAGEEMIELLRQKGRELRYVQLRLADFLWGATLGYDVRDGAARLEDIRRQAGARSIQGQIVYICYEPVAESMRDALQAEEGIHEQQVSLHVAGYGLEEGRWIRKAGDGFSRSDLFTGTPFGEEEPPASYWMRSIEQMEAEREQEMRATFFYGKPRFTYLFLIMIIAVFILMELSGGSQDPRVLLLFGAKFNPLILAGEWWRFITPMFLHIGFMHILFNGVALYSLGALAEQIYGSARFLVIYMLSGISGVVSSFAFSDNISAGASGAIFGLFGAMLYFGTQNKELFFRTLGTNILVVLGINLAIGFLSPGIIDNYAHLGGLVGGFLASTLVGLPKHRSRAWIKAGATALLLFLLWWGIQAGGLVL
ncbi:rhomboid family intramembrane serine protease [Aneurinibacillus danicus]|uniref:Rhomboid protease GluP n=1 Tax=Aneurinibacillus danicus TaxID=267746 RepID=A0A511V9C5_9BACL|nr:rhomboid family intramembrane serine protease [Aneurinibacillus danicus]GEN35534.1 rhomboid protease GluP [Aneurinibacillus danicus]